MTMRFNGDAYPKVAKYRQDPKKSLSEKAITFYVLLFNTILPRLKNHKKA
jgi:hypothetical protein